MINRKQFLSLALAVTMALGGGSPVTSILNMPNVVHADEVTSTVHLIKNDTDFRNAMAVAKDGDTFAFKPKNEPQTPNSPFNYEISLEEDEYPEVKNMRFVIVGVNDDDDYKHCCDIGFERKVDLPGRNITFDLTERLGEYKDRLAITSVTFSRGIKVKDLNIIGNDKKKDDANFFGTLEAEKVYAENVCFAFPDKIKGDVVLKNCNLFCDDSNYIEGTLYTDYAEFTYYQKKCLKADGGVRDLDGNLIFGTSNKVDQTKVNNVIEMINNMDRESWDEVIAARNAYEELSEAEQKLVTNLSDLVKAETALQATIDAADTEDQKAVDYVSRLVENADPADPESVRLAREAYDALRDDLKGQIDEDSYREFLEKEEAVKTTENTGSQTGETGKDTGNENTDPAEGKENPSAGATEIKQDPVKEIAVSKITIKGESTKIAVGKKIRLSAVVAPENATDKKVVWTSSNKKYATVNGSGLVTTKKAGKGKTVKIIATTTDGKVKAVYSIQIKKGVVKSVRLSGKSTVKAGKSIKLKAKVKSTKGAYKGLKWKTSNAKYATVKNGKVMTMKAGKGKSVKITAYAIDGSGKKAIKKIKIK